MKETRQEELEKQHLTNQFTNVVGNIPTEYHFNSDLQKVKNEGAAKVNISLGEFCTRKFFLSVNGFDSMS